MLTTDILDFRQDPLLAPHPPAVEIEVQAQSGEEITVPDAALLFQGDYHRVGFDLVISDQATRLTVHDYFRVGKRPSLASPDGAKLSDDIVSALATSDLGEQYAQNAPALAPQQIGRVENMTGSASAVRNGVSIELHPGDIVLKGDAVQTGTNSSLGLSFIDGTVFSLSSGARMVLNDMVYQAGGQQNSAVLSLVQGSISFLAGQVAKTGDMKVGTPVATMGIRGTLVHTENPALSPPDADANTITARNGAVSFSVVTERDSRTGAFDLYSQNGDLIGRVSDPDIQWLVGSNGSVSQEAKSAIEQQAEFVIAQRIYQIVALAEANPLQPGAGTPTGPQGGGGSGSTTSPGITGGGNGTGNGSIADPRGIFVPGPDIPFDLPPANAAPQNNTTGPVFTAPGGQQPSGTTTPSTDTGPASSPTPPPLASQTIPTRPNQGIVVADSRNGLLFSAGADQATANSERVVFVERGAQDDSGHTPVDPGANGTGIAGDYGTLVIHQDGTYSYVALRATPLAEAEHGLDRFTYTVVNSAGLTSTATLTFDITGVNDAPNAVNDTAATSSATTISATRTTGLLANDTDPDNGETASLRITTIQAGNATQNVTTTAPGAIHGQYGTLHLASDGSYSYVPDSGTYLAPGQTGTDTFTYTVSDGHAATDQGTANATFTVQLTGPGPVLDLDSTAAGTGYSATVPSGAHILGTHVSITNDPTIRTAIVTLNSAPNDGESLFVGGPGVILSNTMNGDAFLTFPDGGHITASGFSGTLTLTGDGSASVADFQDALDNVGVRNGGTLTPGTRTLTVQVSDGTYSSQPANATVVIDQAPVVTTTHGTSGTFYTLGGNPVTVDSGVGVTDDGTTLTGATIKVTLADGGVDTFDLLGFSNGPQSGYTFSSGTFHFNDSSTVTTSYDASTGTLTLTGAASVNDYRLALDAVKFSTTDTTTTQGRTVIFQVNDGTLLSNQGIDKIAVSDTPHFGGDRAITVDEGGVVTLTRDDLASTEAGKSDSQLTYTVSPSSHGFFTLGSDTITSFTQQDVDDGRVSYHRDGSETTSDSFAIALGDGTQSISSTLTITVNPVNDPPTAAPDTDAIEIGSGTFVTGNVLTNDSDPEGDPIRITGLRNDAATTSYFSDGQYGSLVLNPDGSYTYTLGTTADQQQADAALAAGQTQGDKFTYTVSDTHDASGTSTLTISVTGVNDAPTLQLDSGSTNYATTYSGPGTHVTSQNVTISDPDDGAVISSATLVIDSSTFHSGDALSLDNSGSFTLTEDGSGTYTLTSSDGAVSDADFAAELQHVVFTPGDTDSSRTVSVSINVNDGDANSNAAVSTITVNAASANTAPALDLDSMDASDQTGFSSTSGAAGTHLTSANVSIMDPDAGATIVRATLVIDPDTIHGGDTLSIDDTGLSGFRLDDQGSGTYLLTFNDGAAGSDGDFAAELQHLVFTPGDTDGSRTVSVSITVNDGDADSNAAVSTISVTAAGGTPTPTQGGGFGFAIAHVGDQDGDGLSDLVVGAPLSGSGTVDISYSSSGDVFLIGAADGDQAGYSVADAGNLGGPGQSVSDDILVGAPGAFGGKGAAYVFDGGVISGTFALGSTLDTDGRTFVISGQNLSDANARVGTSVSGAGDVDKDGHADVIVGAPGGGGGNGAAYVVYGHGTTYTDVDLASIDSGYSNVGYAIHGAAAGDQFGFSVAGGADINGDGYADVIIGAPHATGDAADSGAAYIVFGQSDCGTYTSVSASNSITDLASVTIRGVAGDHAGYAVANAGDVNGDGFDDLLIGAPDANGGAGAAYVVFGGSNLGGATHTIDLATIASGAGGFVINGAAAGDHLGFSVAGIQDVNDDGLADIIVGAPGRTNSDGAAGSGGAYVVYGKTGTGAVDAGSLPQGYNGQASAGLDITGDGVDAGGNRGFSVASQGERDGNGYDDYAFGNPHSYDASSNTADSGGYGGSGVDNPTSSVTIPGTANGETLTGSGARDVIDGQQGNDRLVGHGGGDYLIGGSGNDTFVFSSSDSGTFNVAPGAQHDTIKDFHAHATNAAEAADVIEIDGYANINSYAALASHLSAANSHDTLITLDAAHTILLKNVVMSTLSTDDFHFGTSTSV